VTRRLVAAVVGLVYLTVGRRADELTIDAWQLALDDLADGPEVVAVVRRLTREPGDLVTAADVWQAVRAERARAALSAQYVRPSERPALEAVTGGQLGADHWRADARRRLAASSGPLAESLRAVLERRYDQDYFEPERGGSEVEP
jgi:hypothetical protein